MKGDADILERLRYALEDEDAADELVNLFDLIEEAADEIERLRKLIPNEEEAMPAS